MGKTIIVYERLPVELAKRIFDALWKTVKTDFPQMSDDEIAKVVSLAVDLCPHCFEDNRQCQCWNDE